MRKNVFAVLAVVVLAGAVLMPGVGHAEGGVVDRATIESLLRTLKSLEEEIQKLNLSSIPSVSGSPVKIKQEIKKIKDDNNRNNDEEDNDNHDNNGKERAGSTGGWITLEELPGNMRISCSLPELKRLHKKDAVYLLQVALKRDGSYPEGWITGYFGPKTEAAVRAFQKKNSLPETGIVDAATVSILNGLVRGWYPDACAAVTLPPGKLQKFGGVIQPVGMTTQMWGTDRLLGDDGNNDPVRGINDEITRALKNAEGKRVFIWGTRDYYSLEGGFWGITAQKVVIRGESDYSILRVLSPADGAGFKTGDTVTIRWDGKDFPNPSEFVYRVELMQTDTVRTLGEVTATSTGELSMGWVVPSDLAMGSYRIQVIQLEKVMCVRAPCYPVESARGVSGWFKITTPISNAAFRVTSPAEGAEWFVGKQYSINWDSVTPRVAGGTVSLTLGVPIPSCVYGNPACMIALQAPYTIASHVSDSGTYTWTIGADVPVWFRDRDVLVTVTFDQGNNTGTSGRFKVKNPVAPSTAMVSMEGISPLSPVTVGLSGGQTIAVFKVKNAGSVPVYLDAATFINNGVATSAVTFDLYASQAGGNSGDVSVVYATGTATTGFGPLSSITESDRMIPGGSWRYLTVKTRSVAANNDTFQVGTASIQSVTYSVKETDLGYSANGDSDFSDTITGLPILGMPSLATVTTRL